MGRQIPDDLNIVGYDNSWMAPQVFPALTTVSLEQEETCRAATSMLVRAISGRPIIMRRAMIRPKLIVRKSTGLRPS